MTGDRDGEPGISVITPCLNRAEFIADAVESVLDQDHPSVEHIIMDGGSTDGTLAVLDGYPHLEVHSQRDDGIYDALNKGVARCRGEIVGFLNTDDAYEPHVLGAVARAFSDDRVEAVCGGASIFSGATTLRRFPAVAPGRLLARATIGAPIFNAWFFRRSLFEDLAGFDLRYRFASDRDLLIRMALRGSRYAPVTEAVYRYRMHPGSITLSGSESGEAPYVQEMRDLAETWLGSTEVGRRGRRLMLRWHEQVVLEQMLAAVHAGAVPRAVRYFLPGLRHNPGLAAAATEELMTRLVRLVRLRLHPSQGAAG